MPLVEYTAEVEGSLLLKLPAEAEELHLKPGDKIQVRLARTEEPKRKASSREQTAQPRQLRGRGSLAGILSSAEFLRRKHEETIQEDKPLR